MEYANVLEEIVVTNLGNWGLLLIPFITGLITSFVSEVVNYVTPEALQHKFWLLLTSVVLSVIVLLTFPYYYNGIFNAYSLLQLILNISVAFLFYPIVGKKLVGKIFAKFEEKANDVINKV